MNTTPWVAASKESWDLQLLSTCSTPAADQFSTANTTFVLGVYAGVGPNLNFTNAASSIHHSLGNVGWGVASLGVQFSFGGGIWLLSVTPPVVSAGAGLAGSVITTNPSHGGS